MDKMTCDQIRQISERELQIVPTPDLCQWNRTQLGAAVDRLSAGQLWELCKLKWTWCEDQKSLLRTATKTQKLALLNFFPKSPAGNADEFYRQFGLMPEAHRQLFYSLASSETDWQRSLVQLYVADDKNQTRPYPDRILPQIDLLSQSHLGSLINQVPLEVAGRLYLKNKYVNENWEKIREDVSVERRQALEDPEALWRFPLFTQKELNSWSPERITKLSPDQLAALKPRILVKAWKGERLRKALKGMDLDYFRDFVKGQLYPLPRPLSLLFQTKGEDQDEVNLSFLQDLPKEKREAIPGHLIIPAIRLGQDHPWTAREDFLKPLVSLLGPKQFQSILAECPIACPLSKSLFQALSDDQVGQILEGRILDATLATQVVTARYPQPTPPQWMQHLVLHTFVPSLTKMERLQWIFSWLGKVPQDYYHQQNHISLYLGNTWTDADKENLKTFVSCLTPGDLASLDALALLDHPIMKSLWKALTPSQIKVITGKTELSPELATAILINKKWGAALCIVLDAYLPQLEPDEGFKVFLSLSRYTRHFYKDRIPKAWRDHPHIGPAIENSLHYG